MPAFFQSWENLGMKDKRAKPMLAMIDYINTKMPCIAVLENVAYLAKHQKLFKRFLGALDESGHYQIYHKVLSTSDYGVPQIRERLYVVMIQKRLLRLPFQWPMATPCPPLSKFWDRDATHTILKNKKIDPNLLETTTYSDNLMKAYTDIKKHYGRPKSVEAVIDIGCSLKYATYQVGVSPTLCARRSASLGYFHNAPAALVSAGAHAPPGGEPTEVESRWDISQRPGSDGGQRHVHQCR